MRDWKQIAESAGLAIPDIDRVTPALDSLEAAFRPLLKGIPHDAEPPLTLRAAAEDLPEAPE
jgi:hypothetical protein